MPTLYGSSSLLFFDNQQAVTDHVRERTCLLLTQSNFFFRKNLQNILAENKYHLGSSPETGNKRLKEPMMNVSPNNSTHML